MESKKECKSDVIAKKETKEEKLICWDDLSKDEQKKHKETKSKQLASKNFISKKEQMDYLSRLPLPKDKIDELQQKYFSK